MKQVSIQDLKAGLSAAIAEAEAGVTIVITRHGEPVAHLTPARHPSVHYGSAVGTRLEPALARRTNGLALATLLEDRGDR